MLIRQANPGDAAAIAAIAESVRYSERDANPSLGYLVFVGTPAEYAARLASNETSFVAEQEGKVVAFLLTSYSPDDTATQTVGDEVMDRIFGNGALLCGSDRVSPDARGHGAAPLLMERMFATIQPSRATACIMHWPMRNKRSIGFFSGRCGFRCIGEYHEGNGFLWGIYEWDRTGAAGDPRYPVGRFLYTGPANEIDLAQRIERIRVLPELLREAVSRLDEDTLDLVPRPGAWTPRQIIHHMADGHQVMAGRARLILTEEQPPVKTFDENSWAELADAKTAPIEESLLILDGLHARLARLIASRPYEDLSREMFHPEQGLVKLDRLLSYLDWHGRITRLKSWAFRASFFFWAATLAHPQVRLERIAGSIRNCTDIQSARDGSGRLFLVRQEGTVAIWKDGQLLDRPFLDIRSKISTGGERGLLGIAFPPGYRDKRWFYVNYTDRSGHTVIARYNLVGADPDLADSANERIVLTVTQPFSNHNGGQLQFGPDGMMYIGLGDGGSANDPEGNGQNRRALLGKMLRIDTESNLGRYEIPSDNPFVNDPSYRPEIWALGLRNPWRYSFDRATGDLYIADVGQNRLEEINFQPRASKGGENYGWVTMEGDACVRAGCNQTGLTLPIWVYPRTEGLSVTGGYVYRGAYYYGDFVTGKIWTLRRQGAAWVNELAYDGGRALAISTFGLDEAGELYLANYNNGEIFRVVPIERPAFSANGVVNAASFTPGMSPGALMTIFTRNVLPGNARLVANAIPLPRSLNGIEVRVNDSPAPLLAAVRDGDSEQINFQLPWELQPGTNARIQIASGAVRSEVVEVPVNPIAPAVFGLNATDALLIRANSFSLVTSPIRPGDSLILYATGLGLMEQPVATGVALSQPASIRRTATLRIAGIACDIAYAGTAPGFVGVYQVNFTVATSVPAGNQDLILTIDSTDALVEKY